MRPFTLTTRESQLLQFIGDYVAAEGIGPSYDEMKDALGLASKSGIARLIRSLEYRGHLVQAKYRARAISLADPLANLNLTTLSGEALTSLAHRVGHEMDRREARP